MNAIQVNARFSRIATSRLPEFKRLAAEALQIARSEPRVLQYEWFFDDAETLCVVRETYEDPAALLEHMANVSDVFARLIEVGGGCELEIFGDAPGLPIETPAGLRRSVFRSPFQRT
jgi:quinol monooxygenase YgiN